jgi:hypothetical protein
MPGASESFHRFYERWSSLVDTITKKMKLTGLEIYLDLYARYELELLKGGSRARFR